MHVGHEGAVLWRVRQRVEHRGADVDAGLDGERIANFERAIAAVELRRIVNGHADAVADAVNHPEHRLPARARCVDAVSAPRHVNGGVDAFDQAEFCEPARTHILGRILRRD